VLCIRDRRRLRQAKANAEALTRFIDLAETCDQQIPLAQVSVLLSVSVRTLSAYVNRHVGMSPAKFMRRQRLMKARERLLAGDTVTHAAVEFGFWNLSVFARYYREQFGELPSETRRAINSRNKAMDDKPKLTPADLTMRAADSSVGFNQTPNRWLSFPCGLRINMETGAVDIPAGLTLDEASRAFWEGLGRLFR
jgi:AraC-like DNA-binding protein